MSNWFLPSTPQDRSHKIPLKYLSEKMCFPNFALNHRTGELVAMMVCSNVDIISDERCPEQTCKWCLTLLFEMKNRILIARWRLLPMFAFQPKKKWKLDCLPAAMRLLAYRSSFIQREGLPYKYCILLWEHCETSLTCLMVGTPDHCPVRQECGISHQSPLSVGCKRHNPGFIRCD